MPIGLRCVQAWVEEPFKEGTRPLAGLTLGLLGCGDIGLQIAKAAKAMGLKTAAFKRDTSAPGENTGSDVLVDVRPTGLTAEHPTCNGQTVF